MNRLLISSIAVLALTACATDPIATGDAKLVPPERVLSMDYAAAGAGTGTVVVKRDTGYAGSACASRLSINAKPAADIRAGERVELHMPAGEYILSVSTTGLCGGGLKETSATVKSGGKTYFRIGYGTSGDLAFAPTAF